MGLIATGRALWYDCQRITQFNLMLFPPIFCTENINWVYIFKWIKKTKACYMNCLLCNTMSVVQVWEIFFQYVIDQWAGETFRGKEHALLL